jgi:hypothetical protein
MKLHCPHSQLSHLPQTAGAWSRSQEQSMIRSGFASARLVTGGSRPVAVAWKLTFQLAKFSIRFAAISGLVLVTVSCSEPGTDTSEPAADNTRIEEVGIVPRPPGHAGRDVGFSAVLQGRSVWVFGDTFLPRIARDGLRWRSSSWSWTAYPPTDGAIGEFVHAVDSDGLARQLLPHTNAEAVFNLAHEGHDDCPSESACGSRLTPWPQALVTDVSQERAVIYYLNMQTGPGGQWDFRSVSGSIALWTDPDEPATRVEPPLFGPAEPDWGSAAVRVEDDIFVYACEFDGKRKPCLVARVPFDSASERSGYRFWTASGKWSRDWQEATPIFAGGSLFSVHYSDYLGKFVAFYIPHIDGKFAMRTADRPQGPWSDPVWIGSGAGPSENWNYALIAHPQYARGGGRVETLGYTHPTGFLRQDIRLVEIRLD